MSLLVAGTIAIDDVKTPVAEEKQLLGGSAAYAALAAAFFSKNTELMGIVGKDFPQGHLDMLGSHGVLLGGVERSEADSFYWSGEYMENMNDRVTHEVAINVLEDWTPKVHEAGSKADIVALANMSPQNQLEVLSQCESPSYVIADSMDLWIEIARQPLLEVISKVDLFVLNDSEAKLLVEESNLLIAGEKLLALGAPQVIIKLGKYGSLLFSRDGGFFNCAVSQLRSVFDPTGAGDTFMGSIAGYLDGKGITKPTFDDLRAGVARGSVMASFTCEAFSTKRLEEVDQAQFDQRLGELQESVRFA